MSFRQKLKSALNSNPNDADIRKAIRELTEADWEVRKGMKILPDNVD